MSNIESDTGGMEVEADAPAPDAAVEDAAHEGGDDAAPDGQGDADGELKTVRKALDKRNRYINNQRNRIRALEAEIEKVRGGFGKDKPAAPELEKFDSVLDYMKADQNFTLEQKLAEQQQEHQLAMLKQQQNLEMQQHVQQVAVQMQELLTGNPDFHRVISSNVAVIDAMPPHIEKMMAELDDAPAATYALAKDGRLQSLYSMPPHLAAAHLVQAEIRGQQYLQQSAPKPQQQQAPKPLDGLKGRGAGNKSEDSMTGSELLKKYKLK